MTTKELDFGKEVARSLRDGPKTQVEIVNGIIGRKDVGFATYKKIVLIKRALSYLVRIYVLNYQEGVYSIRTDGPMANWAMNDDNFK